MRIAVFSFVSGALFALGLIVGGMTLPSKVLGFLNVLDWDPSLMFVMGGAILVYMPVYRMIAKRNPIMAHSKIPVKPDWRLISGAVMFGAGWGLVGYCPGPAITALGSLSPRIILFVASMVVGMLLFHISPLRRR